MHEISSNPALAEAKARYQLDSQMNQLTGKAGRALSGILPSVAGSTTAELMSHYQERSQALIDKRLYDAVLADCQSIDTLEQHQKSLLPSGTFNQITARLADNAIPAEHRMQYASTLSRVCQEHFTSLGQHVETLESSVDQLSVQQREALGEFARANQALSVQIGELAEGMAVQRLTFDNFAAQLSSAIDVAHQQFSACIDRVGEVAINQDKLFAQNSRLSDDVLSMQVDTRYLVNQVLACDIEGYEHIEDIETLHQELIALQVQHGKGNIDAASVIVKREALQAVLSRAIAEKKDFSNKMNIAKGTISGVSALAFILGKPQLSQQIDVVGSAVVSSAQNILGLMGSSLVGVVNPVIAITNLVSTVASLFGAFGSKRAEPSPHAQLLEAIAQLAQQVSQLKREMHARFDMVLLTLDGNQSRLLEQFCVLSREQTLTLALLRLNYVAIQQRFEQQEEQLQGLSDTTHQIYNTIVDARYQTDKDALLAQRNFVIQHAVDQYATRASDIDTLGLHHSVNHQLTDPNLTLTTATVSSDYLHFPTYYAKLFAHIADWDGDLPSMGDPLLVAPAAMVRLLLDYKQFSDPEHPEVHRRIPASSIRQYDGYLTLLSGVGWLMVQARTKKIIETVSERYQQAGLSLCDSLQHAWRQELAAETMKQEQSLGLQLDVRRKQREKGFTDNQIKFNTYGWFEGTQQHIYRRHRGKRWHTEGIDGVGPSSYIDSEAKANYLSRLQEQLKIQNAEITSKVAETQAIFANAIPELDKLTALEIADCTYYMKPDSSGYPYLPITSNWLPEPANIILKTARCLRLGELEFNYKIVENKSILVEVNFILCRTSEALQVLNIATCQLPFDPGFYQDAEAVWHYWMGGILAPDAEGIRQHILISGSMFKWHNWLESHDRSAMRSAIWARVVDGGGYWHKGGEFDYTDAEYHIPGELAEVQGLYQRLATQTSREESILEVNLQAETLERLSGLIKKQQNMLYRTCNSRLIVRLKAGEISTQKALDAGNRTELAKTKMSTHTNDNFLAARVPLSQACAEFQAAFHNLYGLLSFAFHDTLADNGSALALWFDEHVVNLFDIRNSLQHKNECTPITLPILKTLKALGVLRQHIDVRRLQLLNHPLALHDIDCEILGRAADQIDLFQVRYLPFCLQGNSTPDLSGEAQVAFKALVSMTSALLDAKPPGFQAILQSTLNSVNDSLSDMDEVTQSHFVSRLKQHFKEKSIGIEWHRSGAMGARLLVLDEPQSTAQAIGRYSIFANTVGSADADVSASQSVSLNL